MMKFASALSAFVLALLVSSCGPEGLGECDRAKLGGATASGPDTTPYAGQLVLQSSCSGGCHSASAKGPARKGAPASLDFDVVPKTKSDADIAVADKASGVVTNHIDEIWDEVNEGNMPPAPPAGAGPLTAANKETLRNWLACGAPVVELPVAVDPNADAWTRIFTQLSTQCVSCHSTSAAGGGAFILGTMNDPCVAYKNIHDAATSASGTCSGRTLVKSGDPANSVLVQKLTGMSLCGGLMPLGSTMPLVQTNPTLVNDIQTWIMSGAAGPAGCN